MKFLIDAQLPPALTGWLREAGQEAEHVEDVELRNADDRPIWDYALKTGAIIVTKDEHFAIVVGIVLCFTVVGPRLFS